MPLEPALAPDAVAAMIAHMNDDHADSVLGYVHRFAALPAATSARLVGLETTHMLIEATIDGSAESVRIPFDHSLRDAADARNTLIAMARPA
jgi:putative heme iron utilization protein